MTYEQLIQRVVRRSGHPEPTVRRVLGGLIEVMREALIAQEVVAFRTLLKLVPEEREMEVGAPGKPRRRVRRILLRVRPTDGFRFLLRQWGQDLPEEKPDGEVRSGDRHRAPEDR